MVRSLGWRLNQPGFDPSYGKICYIVTYANSHLHTCTYICRIIHNDTTTKTHEGRRRKEHTRRLLFKYIYLSLYCKGLKGLFKGLHVRGCWRPNINFIFSPHCYDRHVVSFLFSWCWGLLHRGPSEGPLGLVWPSLPHLVSTVWKSTGNCIGGFWGPPRSGVALPTTSRLQLSGSPLATASGVSEVPLGRVWPSLPHLVSTVWKSAGNCLGPKLNWVK